eukprot:g6253.t1
MTGFLSENGPYLLDKTASPDSETFLSVNDFSWNNKFHVLYVDNPVGTGFSYCGKTEISSMLRSGFGGDGDNSCLTTSLEEVAQQLTEFLEDFIFTRFSNIVSKSPLFVTGESFAGKYIPFTASHILENVPRLASLLKKGGLAVGNPEVDTILEYPKTLSYLRGQGLLGSLEESSLLKDFSKCGTLVKSGEYILARKVCESWLNSVYPYAGNPFRYDIRFANGTFKHITERMKAYLSRKDVGLALHTRNKPWSSGDGESEGGPVARALDSQIERPGAIAKYAEILENGVRVLIYSGNQDGSPFNHLSVENAFEAMQWSLQDAFKNAPHKPWFAFPGEGEAVSGFTRNAGNFTFMVITNAGHLVPMSQPQVAQKMIELFVNDRLVHNNHVIEEI